MQEEVRLLQHLILPSDPTKNLFHVTVLTRVCRPKASAVVVQIKIFEPNHIVVFNLEIQNFRKPRNASDFLTITLTVEHECRTKVT